MMNEPLQWLADGTAFNPRFGDRYHSSHDQGLTQARGVFLAGNDLPQAWAQRAQWRILETGFGCGLNFLVTWAAWRADPQRCQTLHFTSVEGYPVTAADIVRSAPRELAELAEELAVQFRHLLPGVHRLSFEGGRVLLTLLIGEVVPMLRTHSGGADSLYLDGFSPRVNPQMWSAEVLAALARHCHRATTLATWCVASSVRNALIQNGFSVQKIPGAPPKRANLRGQYAPAWQPAHLDEREGGGGTTSAQNALFPARGLGQKRHNFNALNPKSLPTLAPETNAAKTSNGCEGDTYDVLVIGAGLAGSAAALSLARRGLRVMVLEAGADVAAGASGLPAGVFAPQVAGDDNPRTRLSRAGLRMTVQRLRELSAEGHLSPERDWAITGVLERVPSNANSLKNPMFFNDLNENLPSHVAHDTHWLTAGFEDGENSLQFNALEDLSAALWHANAGWVRPAALVRAQLKHANIHVRTLARVARLEQTPCPQTQDPCHKHWAALDAQGDHLARALHVVIATGAAATALLPEPCAGQVRKHRKKSTKSQENTSKISKNTQNSQNSTQTPSNQNAVLGRGCPNDAAPEHLAWPLRPVRGQVVLGRWSAQQMASISPIALNGNGNFVPCVPDTDSGAFWVMGSTFERDALALPPTPADVQAARAWIAAKARALVPQRVWAAISASFTEGGEHWAALRCTSSDRLPLVGAVGTPDDAHAGLWTLTALGARGLTLSVLCGELLAAWMLDEPLPVEDALAAKLDAQRTLPELPPM